MNETRNCQACKNPFTIESEDFAFYEKIKVPPPTFCPECRNARRMSWRNERSLYKRKCNAPGHTEEIISMFDPAQKNIVFDTKYWWSDQWDPMDYAAPYDFSKPFFSQFSELLKRVPLIALSNPNSVRSDYTNFAEGNKDGYLIFGSGWNENVRYGNKLSHCKDSQDLLICSKCELSYECVGCIESSHLFYSKNSKNCTDSYFLYNCRNCTNCIGCANLVNKSYCILNEQYSKEEYLKKLKELRLGSRIELEELRTKFLKNIYLKAIHRYANIFSSVNCTGDNINHSKNCSNCFDIYQNVEDSRYLYSALDLKDSYDGNGSYKDQLSCEQVDCNVGNQNFSTITTYESEHVRYSWNCHNSKNCFGCYGLRNKEYCILNKQYSKKEYEELISKIITHMTEMPYQDKTGTSYCYGEFFPSPISPFAYNETIAQEYFPISKTEAEKRGLRYKEHDERSYIVTLSIDKVPESIAEVKNSITQEVIACAHEGKCSGQCTSAFKVIDSEIQFYRQLDLPLPVLCPNCRHEKRLKQKNPLKLWHRKCQCGNGHSHGRGECPNEFETSYSPDRPEIIYCEQCYQAEVI